MARRRHDPPAIGRPPPWHRRREQSLPPTRSVPQSPGRPPPDDVAHPPYSVRETATSVRIVRSSSASTAPAMRAAKTKSPDATAMSAAYTKRDRRKVGPAVVVCLRSAVEHTSAQPPAGRPARSSRRPTPPARRTPPSDRCRSTASCESVLEVRSGTRRPAPSRSAACVQHDRRADRRTARPRLAAPARSPRVAKRDRAGDITTWRVRLRRRGHFEPGEPRGQLRAPRRRVRPSVAARAESSRSPVVDPFMTAMSRACSARYGSAIGSTRLCAAPPALAHTVPHRAPSGVNARAFDAHSQHPGSLRGCQPLSSRPRTR